MVVVRGFFYCLLKADEKRAHSRAFAVVGLCFCASHLAARCPARGMVGRVLYTAAVTRPAGPRTDIQCRNRRRQNNRSNRQRRREDTANDPNS